MKKDEAKMVADALRILSDYERLRGNEQEENHTIMCLKAEVTARAAANKVLREERDNIAEERDHLAEGLRMAKEQVANLLRLNQLRHDAETGPADTGK
jgi:hypothetical protein